MIAKWKKELEALGFIFEKWPGGKHFIRDQDFFRQHIWDEFWKSERGKIRINIFIEIKDPFCDDPIYEYVTLLDGRLDEKRVNVPKLGPGSGKFWLKEEQAEALAALLQYGVPWLEENTNAPKLIELFERGLREPLYREEPKTSGLLTRIAERIFSSQSSRSYSPAPIYYYFLSLLYYHTGNKDMSCSYAQKWLKFWEQWEPGRGEPERTRRQLASMGCPPVEDDSKKT